MARRKHKKIAELGTFSNVIETDTIEGQIDWAARFGNSRPLTLELGCGTGQYTLSLAELFPERNFVGIDIKGARIWRGAKTAAEKKASNILFLRGTIERILDYFPAQSVAEIWITFPDPYPRKKHAKHRLTSPLFLRRYRHILAPQGRLHLKTDDEPLFAYTLETLRAEGCRVLQAMDDVYGRQAGDALLHIQTTYEKRHLAAGKKIKYVSWMF